jgi:hypothetical protein
MSIYFVSILINLIFLDAPKPELFYGKVTYDESYESIHPNISAATLEKLLGTKREFFIENEFYKSIYHGDIKTTVLYRGDINRIYRFKDDNDTIYWMDAAIDSLSIINEFTLEESGGIVLGLPCKKLMLTTKRGITTYYFNDQYRLRSEPFAYHGVESWSFYMSTTKALPLQIQFETQEITVTSTATKIEKMKLPEGTFEIPNGPLKRL